LSHRCRGQEKSLPLVSSLLVILKGSIMRFLKVIADALICRTNLMHDTKIAAKRLHSRHRYAVAINGAGLCPASRASVYCHAPCLPHDWNA